MHKVVGRVLVESKVVYILLKTNLLTASTKVDEKENHGILLDLLLSKDLSMANHFAFYIQNLDFPLSHSATKALMKKWGQGGKELLCKFKHSFSLDKKLLKISEYKQSLYMNERHSMPFDQRVYCTKSLEVIFDAEIGMGENFR